jgi:DNA invertase Pin-like site-specific DNA recombinase
VWKFDRLGRSLWHLIELIETLEKREQDFKAYQMGLTRLREGN